MHVEDNYMVDKKMLIENCYFESQINFGIGMGMRPGCDVQFLNCELVGSRGLYQKEKEITYGMGGVFVHDSNANGLEGEQKVSFDNCLILTRESGTHTYQSIDLNLQSQEKTNSSIDIRFTNCIVKNIDNNTTRINMRNAQQSKEVNDINLLVN